MRRGEIVRVSLDPARGSEADKTRPAVVVSNDAANAAATRLGRGVITVVPTTAPQSPDTSGLVERLRTDVLPKAGEGTSLRVYVGGLTAGYDDFAAVIVSNHGGRQFDAAPATSPCSWTRPPWTFGCAVGWRSPPR